MSKVSRLTFGEFGKYVIRDIGSDMYDKVLDYMYQNSFKSNKIFNYLKLDEEENSAKNYIAYVNYILVHDMSIIVLDDEENLCGVVTLKWMTPEEKPWLILPFTQGGKILFDIFKLWRTMAYKSGIHTLDTMHIFDFYFNEELRNFEFYQVLFECVYKVAQLAKKPYVTHLAMLHEQQQIMESIDYSFIYNVVYELYYVGREKLNIRPFKRLRNVDEVQAVIYSKEVDINYMTFNEIEELELERRAQEEAALLLQLMETEVVEQKLETKKVSEDEDEDD